MRPRLEAPEMTSALPKSFLVGGLGFVEGGAENVAERGAAIGRAVLGDRLLLLGHFEGLDRQGDAARLAVELSDPGVDLLAGREALGPLVGAVAGEFGAADEGG